MSFWKGFEKQAGKVSKYLEGLGAAKGSRARELMAHHIRGARKMNTGAHPLHNPLKSTDVFTGPDFKTRARIHMGGKNHKTVTKIESKQ